MYYYSAALNQIFRMALKVLIFFSFAGDLEAQNTKYWARDSVLRNDPSMNGQIQSRVFEGAPIDIVSCNAQGWCYGRVYGHDEGWAKASDLTDFPLENKESKGFFDESERPRDGAKTHHLQDYRSSYGFLGAAIAVGTGTLTTEDSRLLKVQRTNMFTLGWGRYLSQNGNSRWSGELGVSLQEMKNKVASVDKGSALDYSTVQLALGLLKMRPYSPVYGFGIRTRLYVVMLRNAKPLFDVGAPIYTVNVSMLISHGFGNLKKPDRVDWDTSIYFNHRQVMLGIGMNLSF